MEDNRTVYDWVFCIEECNLVEERGKVMLCLEKLKTNSLNTVQVEIDAYLQPILIMENIQLLLTVKDRQLPLLSSTAISSHVCLSRLHRSLPHITRAVAAATWPPQLHFSASISYLSAEKRFL